MRIKIFVTTLILLFIFGSLSCSKVRGASVGTSIFAFLKLDPSPVTSAMGGVYSKPSSQSLMVNQAALTQVKEKEINLQHMSYISETNYSLMTYAAPINKSSSFGVTAGVLGVGGLVRTEYDASNAYGYSKKGTFTFSDNLVNLTYGKKVSGNFSLGAGVKIARENVDGKTTLGSMLSFSGLYFNKKKGEILSFGVFNLGPAVKGYNLPSGGYVGVGSCVKERHFVIGELVVYYDNVKLLKLGFESNLYKVVTLRTGYRYQLKYGDLGSSPLNGFSWGMGINLGKISFDYAWTPFEDFSATHRLGLTFKL
ncbi:MAG: hypothetical protein JW871_06620 [Endomicrobiales bacterium]|nr:hypothetical protein [Endomicrobiales bacterium]